MTKVSGLAAAASLLDTHELGVNEGGTSKKVTGLQIKNAGPRGTLAYAQVTVNQTSITTVVDLTGLTVTTAVLPAGRRLRVSFLVTMRSTVSGDVVGVDIQEGATILEEVYQGLQGVSFDQAVQGAVILTPSAAAHTYKLTAQRIAGTGTLTMDAGAGTFVDWILVEDIGV